MVYPKYVFSSREDITQRNMREYDRKKEIFYRKCEELAPDYYKMTIRERMQVRDQVEKILGYRI